MDKLIIKDLNSWEEMETAYPLVYQMYNQMDFATYQSYVKEMIATNNYKMVAAFIGDRMIGVAGYWSFLMLYCGRYLQVSNLVVDKDSRSRGIGKRILHYLEAKAKTLDCKKIVLDSYLENKKSHPLYFRQNFYIRGFHFMKDL